MARSAMRHEAPSAQAPERRERRAGGGRLADCARLEGKILALHAQALMLTRDAPEASRSLRLRRPAEPEETAPARMWA